MALDWDSPGRNTSLADADATKTKVKITRVKMRVDVVLEKNMVEPLFCIHSSGNIAGIDFQRNARLWARLARSVTIQ